MVKCKHCGYEHDTDFNLCPKCGLAPSVQAITDLPGEKSTEKKKTKKKDGKKKRRFL